MRHRGVNLSKSFNKNHLSILSKTTKDSNSNLIKNKKKNISNNKITILTDSILKNDKKLKDLEIKQKKIEFDSSGLIDYRKMRKSKTY